MITKSLRQKQTLALCQAAGAWTDKNHPELNSQRAINKYLKNLWAPTKNTRHFPMKDIRVYKE